MCIRGYELLAHVIFVFSARDNAHQFRYISFRFCFYINSQQIPEQSL